jgi:hypothetical protein
MIQHVIVIDIVGLEEKHLNSRLLPTISALAEKGEHLQYKQAFCRENIPIDMV